MLWKNIKDVVYLIAIIIILYGAYKALFNVQEGKKSKGKKSKGKKSKDKSKKSKGKSKSTKEGAWNKNAAKEYKTCADKNAKEGKSRFFKLTKTTKGEGQKHLCVDLCNKKYTKYKNQVEKKSGSKLCN
jgi:hypothetical protein